MRAFVLFSSLVTLLLAGSLLVGALDACSSSSNGTPDDLDAGPGTLGSPCDPASASPCLPSGDVCTGTYCDPALHVCAQFDTDAGPPCNADVAACRTSADCDLGLTCGFPVAGGCSAPGRCINPPLACESDAASCTPELPACGCNGLPDPFVIPDYAQSPVASLGACLDAGPLLDGGETDASSTSDASDALDASDASDASLD